MPVVKEWPYAKYRTQKNMSREISDIIHGRISLIYPINLIFDTAEFQRLRRLKQLGASSLVYPSADHSRFAHSLGVYHLAFKFADHVLTLKSEPDSGNESDGFSPVKRARADSSPSCVNTIDVLCVCIAALIHDLGHGPYSHTYERFLSQINNSEHFEHEQMSYDMFQFILVKYPDVKSVLDSFLGPEDYQFIKELINPPKKFMVDGVWCFKGRPKDKSFLYDIVSNKHTGIDVDKLDYILRDSLPTTCSIPFNKDSINRIKDYTYVANDDARGYSRLAYATKVRPELQSIFDSRMKLHEIVYQHKTTIACESMLIECLKEADSYLQFTSDAGQKYKLSECFKDPSAYFRSSDDVLQMVRNNMEEPGLDSARELLSRLETRRIPKFVGFIDFEVIKKLKGAGTIVYSSVIEQIELGILHSATSADFNREDLFISMVEIHPGMGVGLNPIDQVIFIDHRNDRRSRTNCGGNGSHALTGKVMANVYGNYGISPDRFKSILAALDKYRDSFEIENQLNSSY